MRAGAGHGQSQGLPCERERISRPGLGIVRPRMSHLQPSSPPAPPAAPVALAADVLAGVCLRSLLVLRTPSAEAGGWQGRRERRWALHHPQPSPGVCVWLPGHNS